MALFETLTINLGAAITKAVLKLWLRDPLAESASGSVVDTLKKKVEDFETRYSTDQLFKNLARRVARSIETVVEIEFRDTPEHEREAAVLAVADTIGTLDLAKECAESDLDATRLEQTAIGKASPSFHDLSGDAARLARLILQETCAYIVLLAKENPGIHVAVSREILQRLRTLLDSGELLATLVDRIDSIERARSARRSNASEEFETRYRRRIIDRLDHMELFGLRMSGATLPDHDLTLAYITLRSRHQTQGQVNEIGVDLSRMQRVVVRGEAGSGKTTVLRWLAVRAAAKEFDGQLETWNGLIPFFVRLRDYVERDFPTPERLLESVAPNLQQMMPSPDWAHRVLDTNALLLVDGIDELPSGRRAKLLTWLRDLLHEFPKLICVASSRPAALDSKRGNAQISEPLLELAFETLVLEPLSLQASTELINQWHFAIAQGETDHDRSRRIDQCRRSLLATVRERPAIAQLASNPLLCAMLCALNWFEQTRLPASRMELYDLALAMLLDRRDAERDIVNSTHASLAKADKEVLLDAIAYWMLRNDLVDAPRDEVLHQVELVLPRLPEVKAKGEDALQDLLERTGVLRQPQVDRVDFIHRTFLEFMGARAAVTSEDFGVLIGKSQSDSWRETIVFAAGHSRGVQRDKFIDKLLRRPILGGMFGGTLDRDVIVACCLETVGSNLDPSLQTRLRERIQTLFPPRQVDKAFMLAPAASLDPALLRGHAPEGATVVAACIRCAAIAGGPDMLATIASYGGVTGRDVDAEVLRSCAVFDDDEFFDRVMRKRVWSGTLGNESIDDDTLRCFQLLALRTESMDARSLATQVREFQQTRRLELNGALVPIDSDAELGSESLVELDRCTALQSWSRRHARITSAEGKRLGSLSSMRELSLGPTERGVLKSLRNAPGLAHLSYAVADAIDLCDLGHLQGLTSLQLSGQYLERQFNETPIVDLRSIGDCQSLRSLAVTGLDQRVTCLLPSNLPLHSLELFCVPRMALDVLRTYVDLRRLSCVFANDDTREIDVKGLEGLQQLLVRGPGTLALKLPSRIRRLVVDNARSIAVENDYGLEELKYLHLRGTSSISGLDRLVGASLEKVVARNCSAPVYDELRALCGGRSIRLEIPVARAAEQPAPKQIEALVPSRRKSGAELDADLARYLSRPGYGKSRLHMY